MAVRMVSMLFLAALTASAKRFATITTTDIHQIKLGAAATEPRSPREEVLQEIYGEYQDDSKIYVFAVQDLALTKTDITARMRRFAWSWGITGLAHWYLRVPCNLLNPSQMANLGNKCTGGKESGKQFFTMGLFKWPSWMGEGVRIETPDHYEQTLVEKPVPVFAEQITEEHKKLISLIADRMCMLEVGDLYCSSRDPSSCTDTEKLFATSVRIGFDYCARFKKMLNSTQSCPKALSCQLFAQNVAMDPSSMLNFLHDHGATAGTCADITKCKETTPTCEATATKCGFDPSFDKKPCGYKCVYCNFQFEQQQDGAPSDAEAVQSSRLVHGDIYEIAGHM